MAMSRKHYEAVAKDLRVWARPNMTGIAYKELVNQLGLTFIMDNNKFNKEKFTDACEATHIRTDA